MALAEKSISLLKKGARTIDIDEEDLRAMEELMSSSSQAEEDHGDSDAGDDEQVNQDHIDQQTHEGDVAEEVLLSDAEVDKIDEISPDVQLEANNDETNRELYPSISLIDQQFSGTLKYVETVSVEIQLANSFGDKHKMHFFYLSSSRTKYSISAFFSQNFRTNRTACIIVAGQN